LAAAENQAEAILNLVRGGGNPNCLNAKSMRVSGDLMLSVCFLFQKLTYFVCLFILVLPAAAATYRFVFFRFRIFVYFF
jgi:hypothetical protein